MAAAAREEDAVEVAVAGVAKYGPDHARRVDVGCRRLDDLRELPKRKAQPTVS